MIIWNCMLNFKQSANCALNIRYLVIERCRYLAKSVYPCVRAHRAKSEHSPFVPSWRARARTGRYAGLASPLRKSFLPLIQCFTLFIYVMNQWTLLHYSSKYYESSNNDWYYREELLYMSKNEWLMSCGHVLSRSLYFPPSRLIKRYNQFCF